MSCAEANKYFDVAWGSPSNTKSRVSPTAYAAAMGAYTNSSCKTAEGQAAGWWWLRSPGSDQDCAANVSTGGSLSYRNVSFTSGSVRPAFWINLDSGIF